MNPHVGMLDQQRPDGLRLMDRQVIRGHVNLWSFRGGHDVAQEFYEGGARVPGHGLAEHFTRLGIERGKQQQRAVPVALKAVRSAWPDESGNTGSRPSRA